MKSLIAQPTWSARVDDDANGFRLQARQWIGEHGPRAPKPSVASGEEGARVRAWSREVFEAGYAGITWPSKYGGRGRDVRSHAAWLEELARAGVPDHLGIIGLNMVGPTILTHGKEAQREFFLPKILSAEHIWCQGFSEPEAGSDLASVRCSAVRRDGEWVVNGQKIWSSFAHISDFCLLLVQTGNSVGDRSGLTMLMCPMDTPGVEVRPLKQVTGDAEFNEIFFTDARIPDQMVLGNVGDGWNIAITTLSHERSTYAVYLTAQLEAAWREAWKILHDAADLPPTFNATSVGEDLAEIWIGIRGLAELNSWILDEVSRDGSAGSAATASKLRWSVLNQRLTVLVDDCLLAIGESPGVSARAQQWRTARLRARGNSIEGGTSEILRSIIAERVLDLPRSR